MTDVQSRKNSTEVTFIAASAAKLLGSGLISALALTLITSNRWNLLDPAVGVSVVLFLQWQVLGLTLTKLGIDQIIFAAITANLSRRANTRAHMRRRALPLALIFAAIVGIIFSPWAGLACFGSLLLDTQSTFILADLNARERYTEVMVASLLNYPLFFLIVFGLQVWHPVTITVALGFFVLTSFARWIWLRVVQARNQALPTFLCEGNALTGVAPILNFLMFRVDQVLLGTTLVSALVGRVSTDFLRQLLFMGRYQELLSGGITLLGAILLPRLYVRYPVAAKDLLKAVTRRPFMVLAYLLAVTVPLAGYSLLWRGTPLPPILLVGGAIAGLLILPANTITYSMIRQGYLVGLVRSLVVAVACGAVLVAAACLLVIPLGMVVLIPLQLSVFVLLALTRAWITNRHLYE